jgi:2,3-bisphosphoglycerate-independent phosphoglycerate mutase
MDRDTRWERVQKAYKLIVLGEGEYTETSALQALQASYQRDENDEFVEPTVILDAQGKATVLARV